jgi:ABC-2 type transport system ATP-binding protein
MLAVDVKNIKKTFTSKQDTVEAVKDVSFQVEQGEIFGLLGPNGAGKSTTILMLTTLLSITDGSASILGIDVETQDKEVREKIGVALQDTGIDKILTGRELFFTTCRLWGYSKVDSEKRTKELLELVGLTEAGDRRVKTYSGGMKRRLDLGLSLVHSPEILFLDEPTTGLDPGSRRVLWEEIKRLRDSGVTIILTTQYLEEADELADRIAIIDEGLVVAEGTSDELKASIGGDVITLSFYSDEDLEKAKNILTDAVQSKDELRITVADGASKIPEYINKLNSEGIEVSTVSASKPTLDDVFLEVTGNRLEGTEKAAEEKPTTTRKRRGR